MTLEIFSCRNDEEVPMGIKYDEKKKLWIASASKKHPITKQSVTLRRQAGTKAQAKRLEKTLIIEVEERVHAQSVPGWKTMVEKSSEARLNQGLSKATIENCFICLKAHTFEDWSERPIDLITTSEIRKLIEVKVGHRSTSQQKNVLKYIKSVFTYALEDGLLQRNPAPKMNFRQNNKIKKVLTEEQVRTFLNKAKELDWEWYPHWSTAIYTGCRSGELYSLTWDKVNFENRQILIDTSWNNKDGFKSTKSGDDRMIEIAPNLIPILKELKVKYNDSHFVLPRIEAWDKGRQAEELRKFLKGIRLPEIRFHDLRATWATLLLSKGVEPIRVMKAGGWKDMKTMMIYVRKAGVDIRGMMDNFDLHNPSKTIGTLLNFGGSR